MVAIVARRNADDAHKLPLEMMRAESNRLGQARKRDGLVRMTLDVVESARDTQFGERE